MHDKTQLARLGLRAALELRRSRSIPREAAVNVFDLAAAVGVEVRFLDAPSLEGMFVRDPGPRILLPSLNHRPRGRVAFSCGHELGHHQFNHGTKADRYWEGGPPGAFDPEEWLADVFAGYLLMPRQAVLHGFAKRGCDLGRPRPIDLFVVAGELGVGYDTLLTHLRHVLELLPADRHADLGGVTPKAIKGGFLGFDWPHPLTIVDEAWAEVPVDLEVGDLVALPAGADPAGFRPRAEVSGAAVFEAAGAGVYPVRVGGRGVMLRVARRGYVGPLANRFLVDPDEH